MSFDPIKGTVILIEDDDKLREATVQTLELYGLDVQPFESAIRAARYLIPSFTGCIVTDIRMDGMDGLEFFAKVNEVDRDIPVILVTGHGDIEMAVRAMHGGAFDFLAKPFATDHLAAVVRRALHARSLVIDNRNLRAALEKPAELIPEAIVAQSRGMAQLLTAVSQVARTDLDIVIEGEIGTGKEMLARRLHAQSRRHAGPFIAASCALIGAGSGLDGLIEASRGGTLMLASFDTLDPSEQAKLAAILDARDRRRADVASVDDFRLIASTPLALPAMLARGSLSDDLFHRLSSITVRIPPLRERRDDIAALFAKFVRDVLDQTGKKTFEMSAADRVRLLEHDWPGNTRELKNYAFGAVLNLPRNSSVIATPQLKGLANRVSAFERMVIVEALEMTNGNIVRACGLLGTPRKTLYEKLGKLQIDPKRFRSPSKRSVRQL